MNWIEIVGYFASAFVAISFLMISIVRLRVINLIGCLFFVGYGLLLGSVPIIITNTFISIINIYYLIQMFRKDTSRFRYIEVDEKRKHQLLFYIEKYKGDILQFYPYYNAELLDLAFSGKGKVFLALDDLRIVGFSFYVDTPDLNQVSGEEKEVFQFVHDELFSEASIYINVDYVEPKYRDLGLVNKLFNIMDPTLDQKPFVLMLCPVKDKKTEKYLKQHSFQKQKQFTNTALFVRQM